jgi:mannan endo-1,4-beta-mannosidase
MVLKLVDENATAETASLYAYLKNTSGKGLLFGHQHETTQGITITNEEIATLEASDTKNSVGDYAAIYGWDTLSIVLPKREGDITAHAKAAHKRGGIVTISTHFDNPKTGKDAWDNTSAVKEAMPGGSGNSKYNGYLDQVADWANGLKDDSGKPIPVLFRILHENTGSWFWWGAAQSTPTEYINLYRYTVEYLRDVKKVRNFLYVYSPNAGMGGKAETFLERYPGDAYVDVLGLDSYGPAENNDSWLNTIVQDSAMIVKLAEARGKVAALSEVGIQEGDIRAGKKDPDWYTTLLAKLKADEHASKIAYMLVWRNGLPDHFWVPVTTGDAATLADFKAFHADPYTLFNADVKDAYTLPTQVEDAATLAYFVWPTDLLQVKPDQTDAKIRVSLVDAATPTSVKVALTDYQDASVPAQTIDLTLGTDGYYAADLMPNLLTENRIYKLSLAVASSDNLAEQSVRILVPKNEAKDPSLVDNFEGYYALDDLLANSFAISGDPSKITLGKDGDKNGGSFGGLFQYSIGAAGYTGTGKSLGDVDWSTYNTLNLWVKPDGKAQLMVIQLVANGVYWEAYRFLGAPAEPVKASSINPKAPETDIPVIASAGEIQIPFGEFVIAPWDNKTGKLNASKIGRFSIYINGHPKGTTLTDGTLALDDIKATKVDGNGDFGPPPPVSEILFDFPDEASVKAWSTGIWGGAMPLVLSHDATNNAMDIAPSWAAPGNKFGIYTGANNLDLVGATVSVDVWIPQAYVTDGKLGMKVFVKDANWTWGNFPWVSSAALKGDAWNTLTYKVESAASFDWVAADTFTPVGIREMGIEIDANQKPIEVVGNIKLDNFKIVLKGGQVVTPVEPTPVEPAPVDLPALASPQTTSFAAAADITGWEVQTWAGTGTAALSFSETPAGLSLAPTWAAVTDKFGLQGNLPAAVNLKNTTVTVKVFVPAAYVTDGKMNLSVFVKDEKWRYGKLKTVNTASLTPDAWNTITATGMTSATDLEYTDAKFHIGNVRAIGLEVDAGSKPIDVVGNLLINDITIAPPAPVTE